MAELEKTGEIPPVLFFLEPYLKEEGYNVGELINPSTGSIAAADLCGYVRNALEYTKLMTELAPLKKEAEDA